MATRLPSGRWRAAVYIGTDENGKRTNKYFVADTEDEAEFAALTFKLKKGKYVEKRKVTLRAAMCAYIDSKRNLLSPSTILGYEIIEKNFGDFLETPLCDVTRLSLQNAISAYMYRPRNDGKRGTLSAKTVRNAYGLISATLKQNEIYLGDITLPRRQEIEYATPFDKELARIFEAVKGTSIEIPVILAAAHSLRREEICGLKYEDIDFTTGRIAIVRARLYVKGEEVVKEPKTAKSRRAIFVSEYLLKLLWEQRETIGGEYVVPIKPDTIGKRFGVVLKENDIPHCRFHDLRHSFASVLRDHGIDPLYIKSIGGWASDSIMNRIYTQVAEESLKRKSENANNVFYSLMYHDVSRKKTKSQ